MIFEERSSAVEVDGDHNLLRVVFENVIAKPDHIAACDSKKSITYMQLWQSSLALAKALKGCGVCKASSVVVLLDHNADSITSMLSVFMLGAVYVPLDVFSTQKSLRDILTRLSPSAVICSDNHSDLIARLDIPVVTKIDYAISLADIELLEYPDDIEEVGPQDLSHMFFTSGTTGVSKGVVSTYAALHQYIGSAMAEFGFSQQDRFLSIARPSFSISLFEILVPVVAGAGVHVLSRREVLDLSLLSKSLTNVTTAHIGPGLLRLLLKHLEKIGHVNGEYVNLRHLSSGGDVVPQDLLTEASKLFSNAEVFILYGCTEINCMGTVYKFIPGGESWIGRVGKPMKGVQLRLLDDTGVAVEKGEVGSVHFISAGLAKQYFQDSVLTKRKFHVMHGGERIYDSGDLGRITESGDLELVGRSDFQVKVRGMRVEILAVEKAIRAYDCVEDCMVVGEPEDSGVVSLNAYLVLNNSMPFNLEIFRNYLRATLNDFMIPNKIYKTPKLPLNKNLKLDRSKVPEQAEFLIPCRKNSSGTDEKSKLLSEIWQEVLGTEAVNSEDRFFDVGGDSLTAVSMIAKIMDVYNVTLSFDDFIENPSFQVLVDKLEGIPALKGSGVVKLKSGDAGLPPVILICGAIIYKDLVDALDVKNEVYVIYLDEEVDLILYGDKSNSYRKASKFEYIASRYLEKIDNINIENGCFLGGHSFGGILALEIASTIEMRGVRVYGVYLFDSLIPNYFSLQGPIRKSLAYLRKKQLLITSIIKNKMLKIKDSKISNKALLMAHVDASSGFSFPQIAAKIVLFRAKSRWLLDPDVKDLGWSPYYPELIVKDVDGCHMGIMESDNVHQIAGDIINDSKLYLPKMKDRLWET
ncbi:AMP-binding protein [Alteromonas aestuariivivens]|uniref:AMP-binding protein n=1 Tax=Alteromonas aestuariivivens TaxID=1938339 RepID=UPI0015F297E2|nr:AMP-binding protein [Alteromonas aestuariivivens]